MKDQQFWIELIGKEIKKLRIEAGFTSFENFAFEYEISSSYYWKVENGKVNLSLTYLIKILKLHNLDLVTFFKIIEKSIR